MLAVGISELPEYQSAGLGVRRRTQARFERTHQERIVSSFTESTLEALCLARVLAGGVKRRFEQLFCAVEIILFAGDGRELEEHFAATHLEWFVTARPAENHEQRAEGALRAIELALFSRQLAQEMQDDWMRGIDFGS